MSPRLLSVNVGLPREVEWNGKTVRSAIWKEPVPGPRMVRRINVEGDDQADRAGHGGEHRAVFVYQLDSYRYWQRQLGRDDFTYGQFGENFTVNGLADDEVCIGDRYRIGSAVFEVTQPRVTCFRVGIRMDEPTMPSLLVAHHRPGFYLRVIQEGLVEAGDEITKLASGPEELTVAEIDALLYLPGRNRRTLERALRVPALSEGWKGSFRELLARSDVRGAPAAWPGFRPMRVVAITPESRDVASFRLVPEDGAAPPAGEAQAGQYLTLRLHPAGPDAAVLRSYSLSSIPDADGYRISVKREPGGAGSGYLHTRVRIGDVIDVAAPRGAFTLQESGRPVVLVSAGIGATPVVAMLQSLSERRDARPVWWLHGARNREEHSFRSEVERLLAALPDAHRVVSYSAPDPTEPEATHDRIGRLDGTALEAAGVPIDADFYVCGPSGFMRGIGAALAARGVLPDRVHTESFGPAATVHPGVVEVGARAPHPPEGPPGAGPMVLFGRSDLRVAWDDRYGSLLEFAEACDVPVSFSCRTGVCGSCESGVLSGSVEYTTEPLDVPPDGRALLCCSRPVSELTLEV